MVWRRKKKQTQDRHKQADNQRKRRRRLNPRRGFHPDLLADIWQPITDTAAAIERQLIKLATDWALTRPKASGGALDAIRRAVTAGLGRLTRHASEVVDQAVDLGTATARDTLADLDADAIARAVATTPKRPRNPATGVTTRAPNPLRDAILDMGPMMVGNASTLYKQVVHRVQAAPPESDAARLRLAQQVLDDFNRKGITGFVDRAGRRWNMVTYVEMATRTAATALAREAHAQAVKAAGLDVVRVTVMPNCHPFCQPYQGRLLSLTGRTKVWEGEKVVATLAEALANGYNHPNCRHTIQVAVPGAEAPNPDTISPGDYKATQKLRRLERELRAAKLAEAGALTDEARKTTGQKVRHGQGKIRDHITATGIPRNRWREQIDRPR